MATTGKKEYTLRINGVDTAVKDVTALKTVVDGLDSSLHKVSDTSIKATGAVRERAKSLSEEEKAEQKLIATIDKVVRARTDTNKAQIEANIAARETQREVTREIQIRQQAEGSIKQMGMQLTDLRNRYEGLSRAEREDVTVGGELLQQIQALDTEYKALRESTGNFRDSVGNYEKALSGLEQVSAGIDNVSKSGMGLAQGLLGVNQLMGLFGQQTEEDAERAQRLQKIIALLSIAQQVNNNLLKAGIVQNKLAVVTDTIRTTQIKAKTAAEAASTKGTVAATIAQRALNAVASANPYVILALALVALGSALYSFASGSDRAKKKLAKLNREIESTKKQIGRINKDVDFDVAIARASGESEKALRQMRLEAAKTALAVAKANQDMVNSNRKATNEMKDAANKIAADAAAAVKAVLDENVIAEAQARTDAKKEELSILRAAEDSRVKLIKDGGERARQALLLTYRRQMEDLRMYAEKAKEEGRLTAESEKAIYETILNLAQQRDAELKKLQEEQIDRAREARNKELSILRAAEDARVKLIQDSDAQARKALTLAYDRQIEDIRRRLATETELTKKAKEALNDTIVSLERQRDSELEKLQTEQAARALELQQQVEDSRIALIVGGYERQTAELNAQYDRQIATYKKRQEEISKILDEDDGLTDEDRQRLEEQQQQITELVLNAQKARDAALSRMAAEQLDQRAEQQLTAVEDALDAVRERVDEVVVRSKTGLELIDVEATRKNLADTNAALDEYIAGLRSYLGEAKAAHDATLATLQEGTPEYVAEQQKYARTVEDVTQRIKGAQEEQAENTEASARAQLDALQELFEKMAGYADQAAQTIGAVADTLNMGLQMQLDALNEQLDALDERYDEAQKRREEAAKNVEDIEAQMQSATGRTTEALKVQLQEAMHARGEAEREERRLAKEKERLEAEIERKEKQRRRADLIVDIAVATADVAAAVAKAFKAGPIIGQIMAGIIAAAGAVQIGIMTRQLVKLADGGEIVGPSHANGGVPIPGTDYEAEGGEFVVNKRSYGANTRLVNFINDNPRPITAADLLGVVSENDVPVVVSDASRASEDRIVEAIEGINMRPVVSVTDINRVNDNIVAVEDLADF